MSRTVSLVLMMELPEKWWNSLTSKYHFICRKCSKSFPDRVSLQRHKFSHLRLLNIEYNKRDIHTTEIPDSLDNRNGFAELASILVPTKDQIQGVLHSILSSKEKLNHFQDLEKSRLRLQRQPDSSPQLMRISKYPKCNKETVKTRNLLNQFRIPRLVQKPKQMVSDLADEKRTSSSILSQVTCRHYHHEPCPQGQKSMLISSVSTYSQTKKTQISQFKIGMEETKEVNEVRPCETWKDNNPVVQQRINFDESCLEETTSIELENIPKDGKEKNRPNLLLYVVSPEDILSSVYGQRDFHKEGLLVRMCDNELFPQQHSSYENDIENETGDIDPLEFIIIEQGEVEFVDIGDYNIVHFMEIQDSQSDLIRECDTTGSFGDDAEEHDLDLGAVEIVDSGREKTDSSTINISHKLITSAGIRKKNAANNLLKSVLDKTLLICIRKCDDHPLMPKNISRSQETKRQLTWSKLKSNTEPTKEQFETKAHSHKKVKRKHIIESDCCSWDALKIPEAPLKLKIKRRRTDEFKTHTETPDSNGDSQDLIKNDMWDQYDFDPSALQFKSHFKDSTSESADENSSSSSLKALHHSHINNCVDFKQINSITESISDKHSSEEKTDLNSQETRENYSTNILNDSGYSSNLSSSENESLPEKVQLLDIPSTSVQNKTNGSLEETITCCDVRNLNEVSSIIVPQVVHTNDNCSKIAIETQDLKEESFLCINESVLNINCEADMYETKVNMAEQSKISKEYDDFNIKKCKFNILSPEMNRGKQLSISEDCNNEMEIVQQNTYRQEIQVKSVELDDLQINKKEEKSNVKEFAFSSNQLKSTESLKPESKMPVLTVEKTTPIRRPVASSALKRLVGSAQKKIVPPIINTDKGQKSENLKTTSLEITADTQRTLKKNQPIKNQTVFSKLQESQEIYSWSDSLYMSKSVKSPSDKLTRVPKHIPRGPNNENAKTNCTAEAEEQLEKVGFSEKAIEVLGYPKQISASALSTTPVTWSKPSTATTPPSLIPDNAAICPTFKDSGTHKSTNCSIHDDESKNSKTSKKVQKANQIEEQHETSPDEYHCPICNINFENARHLRHHQKTHKSPVKQKYLLDEFINIDCPVIRESEGQRLRNPKKRLHDDLHYSKLNIRSLCKIAQSQNEETIAAAKPPEINVHTDDLLKTLQMDNKAVDASGRVITNMNENKSPIKGVTFSMKRAQCNNEKETSLKEYLSTKKEMNIDPFPPVVEPKFKIPKITNGPSLFEGFCQICGMNCNFESAKTFFKNNNTSRPYSCLTCEQTFTEFDWKAHDRSCYHTEEKEVSGHHFYVQSGDHRTDPVPPAVPLFGVKRKRSFMCNTCFCAMSPSSSSC